MKTLLAFCPTIVGTRFLFPIITSCVLAPAEAQNRVLFIGNSFTIGWSNGVTQTVGGVPVIFDALARAGENDDPDTVMSAVAGMNFEFHVDNPTTQHAITSRKWTHVVLQNRSAEPTHLAGRSVSDHHSFGTQLYEQVVAHNAATQVVLFETFARADAHPLITGTSSPTSFASTSEFQEEVRTQYADLAKNLSTANPELLHVQVAPVGSAWERAGGLLPTDAEEFVDLHSSDEYHGNDNGYYLTAAVIYATIYRKSPEGLSDTSEVEALKLELTVDAAMLERVAWNTVQSKMLVTGHSLLIDFGADPEPIEAGNDDPNTWNVVSTEVGATNHGVLRRLFTATGSGTNVNLEMIRRFTGTDTHGTREHPDWPASATGDSLISSPLARDGTESSPQFKLCNLDRALEYTFTVFASRHESDRSYDTTYTVAGSAELVGALEPWNNDRRTVTIGTVLPDGHGSITLTVAPTKNPPSGNQEAYLGILQIDASPAPSSRRFEIIAIKRNVDGITITWASVANSIYAIESSHNLEKWNMLKDGIASGGRTTAVTVGPIEDSLFGYYRVNRE
ncbi:MAG: hypothetical protein ACI9R3_002911 [Verrucomicrobiales bacterium]|jgi:hypothetical protein